MVYGSWECGADRTATAL